MKPRHLKAPFLWQERRPCIQDGILYVPNYYFEHELFSANCWRKFLGNNVSIACELCSGNGDWVVAQAKQNPETHWIAVEQRFDRVRKIWSKMTNYHIHNLRIVCGTAQTFFRYYVPSTALEHIVVNFPDPWPKSRHHKHRLFQPAFVQEIFRVLQDSAVLALATDHRGYLEEAIEVIKINLMPVIKTPHYQKIIGNYGESWFEKLWREKGEEIFYTEFVKKLGYS
ncbi:tRNA (guanine(46)-N(7))-methyltransferase TrmB [Candidatus Chlamydia sanziniae]|uniref:tRNA (guanine(46)-N(7))-methyltransferase TrmB n=1 Tax=Candidatus Chlamydia sanziniae TaxID=1806891 RepID=UPI00082953EB|nr:tRNA (guanosine(46)-N(7))-methyltransferase TrmB [Candidatus Chlamydia sanziniae]